MTVGQPGGMLCWIFSDRTWLTETTTGPGRTQESCSALVWAFIFHICNMVSIHLLSKRIFTLFFVCFADLSDTRSLFLPGRPPVRPAHSDLLHDACVGQLQVGVFLYLCIDIYKYFIYIWAVNVFNVHSSRNQRDFLKRPTVAVWVITCTKSAV